MTSDDDGGSKSWLQTLPGLLTALAAALTAIGGLIAAFAGLLPDFWSKPSPTKTQDCIAGYVWRQAIREDHVCVTLETHMRTLQDNDLAGSRRNPAGGPYGADSCKEGYVWRDAFDGDRICVTPDTRAQAKVDNEQAALRVKH
jgi:hypothetical protein